MSNNIFNNHPLIQNSNTYSYEQKSISIHSEDRDISKFPNASLFEIELPQDYLNIVSARLSSWSFPANYNVFSVFNFNLLMTFKFTNLYNPGSHYISDPLLEGIFAALYSNLEKEYTVTIQPGFYNPDQMSTELTNRFNESVTTVIYDFLNDPANSAYAQAKNLFTTYNCFAIVYNTVAQKLWFGNGADQFVLTNDSLLFVRNELLDSSCYRKRLLPDFSAWGLPSYLGFTRCPAPALSVKEYNDLLDPNNINNENTDVTNNLPRFYYGDVKKGDNGYWLLPSYPGATVYFLQAPLKISFMGPAYMYMEIDGLNCIDETSPWNLSEFTTKNNLTNGVVNSSFTKIAIPTTPISQWFDRSAESYKYFNPPAERLRRLKLKIRYHNGQLVDFGQFEYSFVLELNILRNQMDSDYSISSAVNLGKLRSLK
jgi:hypothetical protein